VRRGSERGAQWLEVASVTVIVGAALYDVARTRRGPGREQAQPDTRPAESVPAPEEPWISPDYAKSFAGRWGSVALFVVGMLLGGALGVALIAAGIVGFTTTLFLMARWHRRRSLREAVRP
jgi:hypothetical protein